MKTDNRLRNKVVLVTGANRGIGKEIVHAFLANGASKVYLAVRDLNSTGELQKMYPDQVKSVYADMSQAESIKTLSSAAPDVDIVVNNAGVLSVTGPLDEQIEQQFLHEVNVNALGLLRIAKAFAPTLKKNKGTLVQINSVASLISNAALCTYSASKAASYSFTLALRDYFSDFGVRVVSVHPGPIKSDMSSQAGMDDIAEPASVVADSILDALRSEEFLVFPDHLAKEFGQAYTSYAQKFIDTKEEIK